MAGEGESGSTYVVTPKGRARRTFQRSAPTSERGDVDVTSDLWQRNRRSMRGFSDVQAAKGCDGHTSVGVDSAWAGRVQEAHRSNAGQQALAPRRLVGRDDVDAAPASWQRNRRTVSCLSDVRAGEGCGGHVSAGSASAWARRRRVWEAHRKHRQQ